MIRRFVRLVTTLGGAAAFPLGCGDSVGPHTLAGRYELVRYEGNRLPAITNQSPSGTSYVVGQRFVIGADGTGTVSIAGKTVDAAHPQGDAYSYSHPFTYRVRDNRIEITYVCPPNADCIAGPHLTGERLSGGLALSPPTSSKPASLYTRIE